MGQTQQQDSKIILAFREATDEPEDFFQLVLGMTPPSFFRELFAEGDTVRADRFPEWFDQKTARFGDKDIISTVRDLVGHSAKFDYDQVLDKLPKVDLPALRPFYECAHAKQPQISGRRTTL